MYKRLLIAVALLLLLAAGVYAATSHHNLIDTVSLRAQLRAVSLLHVVLGVACIYAGFWLRALRWKILLGPATSIYKPVATSALVAPQFIGFTAVALFGRLADLARPYLIARRTGRPVAAQIAVYSLERTFDLAAAAVLFSVTLAFAPHSLPHHEAYVRAGIVSLAATIFLAAFATATHFAGARIAATAAHLARPLSANIANSLAEKILDFRTGIASLTNPLTLATALGCSLLLWLGIAEAYVQSAHAFTASPQLASITFTQIMLLFAVSLGGSLLQLPILGWFTQIAVNATAIHAFYGVPLETATACAAVILFTTSLSIIPAGLIAARFAGITLREAATI